MGITRRAFILAATASAFALSSHAAVDYPTKPINLIVPYAPGGLTDRLARDLAAELQHSLGKPVVVENRAGANSLVGTRAALAAPADGYTLFMMTPALSTGPFLQPDVGWPEDPVKAFQPLSMLMRINNVVVAPESSPYNTIQDVIEDGKKSDEPILFGTSAVGAPHFLSTMWSTSQLGIKAQGVMYKGTGPMVLDLLGGQLTLGADSLTNFLPHLPTGKVKVLLVLGPDRSPLIPDVPSFKDLGLSGFDGSGWSALGVAAGTSPEIVERLSTEVNRILRLPQFKKYEDDGDRLIPGSPEEARTYIQDFATASGKVIEQFNIRPE